MKFSFIIPIYNEEKTILQILKKLNSLKFKHFTKEIIVINDGSTDGTLEILKNNNQYYDIIVSNISNKGKGFAVKEGLNKSTGTHIVFQDGDLEYEPSDLLKFEDVFINFDADGIIGSRFKFDKYTRSHNFYNRIGNLILTFFFNILYNTTFTDIYSCYLCFKRDLVSLSQLKSEGFEQHAEILCQVVNKGKKFYEIPINYDGRGYEEGKKIRYYHIFSVLLEIIKGKFKN